MHVPDIQMLMLDRSLAAAMGMMVLVYVLPTPEHEFEAYSLS